MPKLRRRFTGFAELEAIAALITEARREIVKQSIGTPPVNNALAKLNQARVRLLALGVALEKRVDVACGAYPDCKLIGECQCDRQRRAAGAR